MAARESGSVDLWRLTLAVAALAATVPDFLLVLLKDRQVRSICGRSLAPSKRIRNFPPSRVSTRTE